MSTGQVDTSTTLRSLAARGLLTKDFVGEAAGMLDLAMWRVRATVEKRWGDWTHEQVAAGLAPHPYEVVQSDWNALMTKGANQLWQGVSGGSVAGGAYNSTNAALVVGDNGASLGAATVTDVDVAAGATVVGTAITTVSNVVNPTITTSASHTLTVGQVVTIKSVVGSTGVNGTFAVATVPTGTTFTVTLATAPGPYTSGGTVTTGVTVGTPTALSESGTDCTVTVANSLVAGQVVQIMGATPAGYNGTWVVTSATGSAFHFTNTASGLGAGSAFGPVVQFNKFRQNVSGAPTITNNQIQYAATFGTANANHTWGAWGLDNSGTGQAFTNLLNHAISNLGSKTSASSWSLTATLTLS